MKRRVALALAIALLLAAATLAAAEVWNGFVDRDTLNVYTEQSKHSKVVKTLKGGDQVILEGDYGDWYGIYYENKRGEQKVGYVVSKYISFAVPQRYCKHKWSPWVVNREPTCTRKGLRTRECSRCGLEQAEDIKKLSHEYGKWVVTRESTCTEKGERYRECKLCGHRETQEIKMLAHEYGKWIVLEEPTCTEKGERVHRCMVCGYRETQEMARTAHEYGQWKVTKEATCTSEGARVRKCEVCGHRETQVLAMLPHEYSRWTVTRESTCTRKGSRVRTCLACGHEDVEAIAMLPHQFSWEVTVQATDHSAGVRSRVCAVCGKVDSEQSFDPAGTLRRGARGEDVRRVQQQLADQGYLSAGGVDGIFGGGMERAVMQFQRDQGLNPDGVAWPQTIKRLNHDFGEWRAVRRVTRSLDGEYARVCKDCGYEERRTIPAGITFERKQRGEGVRTLQRMLNDLGCNAGTADGAYGPKLDNAFELFAADNNLFFTPGSLRPADVDALVNAWIANFSDGEWMGRGDRTSPVRLVLSLTPRVEDDGEGPGVETVYDWRLTNLGTERCRFCALLLCYGEDPDFRSDGLVMVLDGIDLQRDGANSATGSFTVAADWGDKTLNFCALATSSASGAAWLSNARSFAR